MEPGVKVDVSEDNKSYSWEGNRTGSGNMTITKEEPNKSIAIDLLFLKPYRSKAKVDFYLKGNENSTEVNWTMDNSLPFFMFWMKNQMVQFIGMDYDRGWPTTLTIKFLR
ncbi:MAG: hypothetical protein MK078_07960 [Crocinitomicaceae bacterium]|nr:hypothetical protein [Crocinitomicaceae bacterium]